MTPPPQKGTFLASINIIKCVCLLYVLFISCIKSDHSQIVRVQELFATEPNEHLFCCEREHFWFFSDRCSRSPENALIKF